MSKAINSYKYENEINFPINEVKNAVRDILTKNKVRFLHEDKDLNDMFGTYNFGEIKCSYMLTLTKVDENNTKITLTCSERQGFFEAETTSPAQLESYAGEFLNILGAKLSGKSDEEMKEVVSANNSGEGLSIFGVIIGIIGFIATILICLM